MLELVRIDHIEIEFAKDKALVTTSVVSAASHHSIIFDVAVCNIECVTDAIPRYQDKLPNQDANSTASASTQPLSTPP